MNHVDSLFEYSVASSKFRDEGSFISV